MDTKSSKCVHLVEGGTNGSQYVNMAPMGKTSLGRVIHARKRQKTSFTNLETHGDGCGYLACDTCSSGVPNEIVPAEIVPIGNILVGNNIGFQTHTKGYLLRGPKEGGNAMSPLHSRGSPTKANKIISRCLNSAFSDAQKRAEMRRRPCILGCPQQRGTCPLFLDHMWTPPPVPCHLRVSALIGFFLV